MKRVTLLDTQLLVLLVVGETKKTIIPKHKNLTEFTEDDFDLLLTLLGPEPQLILLPNIVSEAANLLRHHRNPERAAIMATLKQLVLQSDEQYVDSATAVKRGEYVRLGLTDSAILEAGKGPIELVTADAALFIAALGLGLRARNFNHEREAFGIL